MDHCNLFIMKNFCAGTGNVLKIQQLLHICSEHIEAKPEEKKEEKDKDKKDKDKDKKKDKETSEDSVADLAAHQSVATLGISLIAMGEEIGSEMALRSFGHLVSDTNLIYCFQPNCSILILTALRGLVSI